MSNKIETIALGEVCDILDSYRVPISDEERYKRAGSIPYFGANGQVGWIDDYIFDEELVLIAEDGGFFDEYATRPIAYRIVGKSWVNNHAHVLRARSITTNAWVFWNLVHRDIRFYIKGGTRAKLNQAELRQIEIPFPSLKEQRAISAILDSADAAVQNANAMIAKLHAERDGLLHDLLTRGVDENGALRDPDAHPEHFKGSELGRIPADWELCNLEDCTQPDAPITYGIVQAGPHVEDGIPYIRTGDMSGDKIQLDSLLRTSPGIAAAYKRSEVHQGEIVCAIRATVGKVLEVPPELDGANLTQGTARIAPHDKVSKHFLLWYLRSEIAQNQIALAVKGSTFFEITLESLRKLVVLVPRDRREQDAIALALDTLEQRIEAEKFRSSKLKKIKQGLMDDLLTGRVRVSDMEGWSLDSEA